MESSVGTELWSAPAATRTNQVPAARQALQRLIALPDGLGMAILITALFSAIVLAIAAVYGAPLSFPRERVSLALGYSAVLPVGVAIAVYVVLRLGRSLLRKPGRKGPPLLRMVATDLTLMGLFVVATYFHFSLKTWVQVINPHLFDAFYFDVDNRLRPVLDLIYMIRSHVLTVVPNTDAWYQTAFLLMFISGFCSLSVTRNPIYPRFCLGVLLTMSLGALSYMIAPALGPFIYEQGLNQRATESQVGMLWAHQEIKREGMAWIAEAGPSYFTGGLAAMPSLHIAHAAVMTWFIFLARSPLVPIFLAMCFWVVIESVASRWHYLIDIPAGLLLAVLVVWLAGRLAQLADKAAAKTSTAETPS